MANARFRFAVTLESVPAGPDVARTARALERLGYDMVMVGDHIPGHRVDPIALLT